MYLQAQIHAFSIHMLLTSTSQMKILNTHVNKGYGYGLLAWQRLLKPNYGYVKFT